MKMTAEYLEHVRQFEQLAAEETQPELKQQLLAQARAYRKLADERATALNVPISSLKRSERRGVF